MMKLFRPLFYLVLIGLLITGSMGNKNSFLLKTEHANWGMISFQFAGNNAGQKVILNEWEKSYINHEVYSKVEEPPSKTKITGLVTAKNETWADYGFIFFYVAFLGLSFYRYKYKVPGWQVLALMVAAGGVFDLMENILTLKVLYDYPKVQMGSALLILILSSFKFFVLIFTVVYFFCRIHILLLAGVWLRRLSIVLKSLVAYSWKFRIVLLVLAVLFLCLALADQGQDLLVTINTSFRGIICFYLVITIFACINWYLPKIYDYQGKITFGAMLGQGVTITGKETAKLDYARLLGTFTFLVPATGLLITMQSYHIKYIAEDVSPVVILLSVVIFYVNLLRYNGLDVIYKPEGQFRFTRYTLTIALIFGLLTYWGLQPNNIQPYYLGYLSLGFFLLSFGFLITVTYRTNMPYIGDVKVGPLILVAGLVVIALFIAFNFETVIYSLTAVDRFFSLPIVIAGLITYALLFSFLLIMGRKYGIQIITLLLAVTFYLSSTSISNFHSVKVFSDPVKKGNTDSLKVYIRNWLKSRREEVVSFQSTYGKKPYPVFFVNAYGGGIRATAWTTMVIGRLDEALRECGSDGGFQHYVFSYSGASGGTIGMSLLCAARASSNNTVFEKLFYPGNAKSIYQHDYLTANLVGMFGRDALMSSFGLDLYEDRARLQEKSWETYMKNRFKLNYSMFLQSGWHSSNMEVPLLFANTYDINTGFKGIVAPVLLDPADFPGAVFIQDFIRDKDIRLSTAAFISARFPYVSPTAKFNEQHHFTDGGTLENSGAETSLQVLSVFKRELDTLVKHDSVYKYISINLLSLPNSVPLMDSVERVKNLYEVAAPLFGVINSSNGNTIKADSINRFLAKRNGWNYISMRPRKIPVRGVWPVLPLGWQISDYAIEQMQNRVQDKKSEVDAILKAFPSYKGKKRQK